VPCGVTDLDGRVNLGWVRADAKSQHIVFWCVTAVGWVAAALGAAAAIGVIWLSFAEGSSGHNECALVSEASRWDTGAPRSAPAPGAACELARARREAMVATATDLAAGLLAMAAICATARTPVSRAEDAAARRRHRTRMQGLRPGGDVTVAQRATTGDGLRAHVVETLSPTDDFDVLVNFDDDDESVYAFTYREVIPRGQGTLASSCLRHSSRRRTRPITRATSDLSVARL
jgi:hypothetical protein